MPNGVGVGRFPAHSLWRQSQEHCCPGSLSTRAAAAEDGGALGSLCEVIPNACTSSTFTWQTAQTQTRGVEFTGSLRKMPKTLCGHPLKPKTRPFNSDAQGLTMSRTCMTTPQIRSSAPKRRPSTPPHVGRPKGSGCNRSSRAAVLEGHRAFFCLGEAAASVEAASLGDPANSKRCSWWLQHVLATAAAQPQNRLEKLNSGEPASPHPPSQILNGVTRV